MNYLVISDLHGSVQGAELFEAAYELHLPDAILFLGDALYHGPRNDLPAEYAPKQVIPILNAHAEKIIAVRGNCDAEVDQMVLGFPLTADYCEFYLGSRKVFMTHGHVYGPVRIPALPSGSILLYGHTHIPAAESFDGILHLNPGSLSIPKSGHPASYGILEETGFTVFDSGHHPYLQIEF